MSFVGTRPEAVKYVKEYKPEYMATLLLPAGITSEASIRYKDEAEFPFVRVDFFIANGRYYFAELTFTPSGGMMPFNPDKYDLEWGKLIDLSRVK